MCSKAKTENPNPLLSMAVGHQSGNPTCKRGSIGVEFHFISHRRRSLSRDRIHLGCREWSKVLVLVLTLPPLRFGLLVRRRWP